MRHGDTSPDGMRKKARFVMAIMQDRLRTLGGDFRRVTAIDIYTAQPIHALVLDEILKPAGPAAIHGVHWSRAARRTRASTTRWTCAA